MRKKCAFLLLPHPTRCANIAPSLYDTSNKKQRNIMKLSTKQQIQTIAAVMRAMDPTITDLQAICTARYVLNHRFGGDYAKALEHAHDPYLVNGIICW
jgi:hypothetical protein